jgi:hypothetical protein
MYGGNFATMDKPLERPGMDLQDRRSLIAVQQWLTVDSAIRAAYACGWFFLVGHGNSFTSE